VPPNDVLILTPLRIEARAIIRAIERSSDASPSVVTVGPRAQRLPPASALTSPRLVVVAGLAGSLDPDFGPGDVVLDAPPPGYPPPASARPATIHTSAEIVSTPAEKARRREATGAGVVDMEHAIVREALAGTGVHLCGVRVVLDGADEALPPILGTLVDEAGRTSPHRVAGALCRGRLPVAEMMRLGVRSREATRRLGEAVADLARWALRHPSSPERAPAHEEREPACQ